MVARTWYWHRRPARESRARCAGHTSRRTLFVRYATLRVFSDDQEEPFSNQRRVLAGSRRARFFPGVAVRRRRRFSAHHRPVGILVPQTEADGGTQFGIGFSKFVGRRATPSAARRIRESRTPAGDLQPLPESRRRA